MSRGEWEALGRKVDSLQHGEPTVDAAIYALHLRTEPAIGTPVESTKLGKNAGTVVVKWTDGSHGTRNAPRYGYSIDETLRMVGNIDERVELWRSTDGSWYATIDEAESTAALPSMELAVLSAACHFKAMASPA